MTLKNCYEDTVRASAYARLEFPGTYFLAYRDLPALIDEHAQGARALDFGCGSGRSTRFLKSLGFHAVGLDISEDMIRNARALDADGDGKEDCTDPCPWGDDGPCLVGPAGGSAY